MRIVFMAGRAGCFPFWFWDALVEAGHEIAAVYCQPPRPAGAARKSARRRFMRGPRLWGLRCAIRCRLRAQRRRRNLRRSLRMWRLLWPMG